MTEEHFLSLKAESGGWNSEVYWEVLLSFAARDSTALLKVNAKEKKFETKLAKEQVGRIKEFLSQIIIFQLAASNYDVDLSDDAYHLGVTCEYVEGKQRFYHKIPTGPVVVVSGVAPSHEQMYRFLHLITNIADMAESLSGIAMPSHVKLRWVARQKELLAMTQLALSKSKASS